MALKIYYIFLVCFWAFFIFFLSSIPGGFLPSTRFSLEELIAHFYLYALLSILIFFAFYNFNNEKLKLFFWIIISIVAVYGATDEWHQHFVPGRFMALSDWLIDCLGAIAGAYLSYLFFNLKKPKLLLHICCVGCGVFVSRLLNQKYRVILYFTNANIFPESEYQKRLIEAKKIARMYGLKIVEEKYNHNGWLEYVKGLENEPERGRRCEICYYYRLSETAKMAKNLKIKYIATTLTTSPHKNAELINKIGNNLAVDFGLKFLDFDFKKHEGFKKSSEISKKLGLYRQNYCGCEYSK